jgi:DNA-binding NarL/FixJ family response regulator
MEASLRSMFDSLPSVEIIASAVGCLSALQLVREQNPHLLVIDSNLPRLELELLLDQIKREGFGVGSLVVTATRDQERLALAAGADYVFPRYGSNDQLHSVVAGFGAADS